MERCQRWAESLGQCGRPTFNWRQWRFYLLAYCIGFIVAVYLNQFVLARWDVTSALSTTPTLLAFRPGTAGPVVGKAPYQTTFGYGTNSAGEEITTKPVPSYLLHNILDESGIPKIYVKALGRLGNCLFTLISGYSIAAETKHRLVLADGFRWLETIFPNLNVTFEEIPQNVPRISQGAYATYQEKLIGTVPPHDVLIDGYLQSYKFSVNHTDELKQRLQFADSIVEQSHTLLSQAAQFARQLYGEDSGITYIGIHIRRGDLVRADKINVGYFVVDEDYIVKAMLYFRLRYQRVLFVVCSDDISWCREAIVGDDVWLQEKRVPGEVDLALLSACNHTIMSVGTFGWTAGWMAGGEVTFYDPPVNASRGVGKGFTSVDYYPPDWLPVNKYNLTYIQKLARTLPKKKLVQFRSFVYTTTPTVTSGIAVPTKSAPDVTTVTGSKTVLPLTIEGQDTTAVTTATTIATAVPVSAEENVSSSSSTTTSSPTSSSISSPSTKTHS